jgi:hypothetical protein
MVPRLTAATAPAATTCSASLPGLYLEYGRPRSRGSTGQSAGSGAGPAH